MMLADRKYSLVLVKLDLITKMTFCKKNRQTEDSGEKLFIILGDALSPSCQILYPNSSFDWRPMPGVI